MRLGLYEKPLYRPSWVICKPVSRCNDLFMALIKLQSTLAQESSQQHRSKELKVSFDTSNAMKHRLSAWSVRHMNKSRLGLEVLLPLEDLHKTRDDRPLPGSVADADSERTVFKFLVDIVTQLVRKCRLGRSCAGNTGVR